jgi:tripartite ATP-independent transporter DctP family solute receptor
MPYLYRDAEHLWKVLNGPIGRELLQSLEPSGFYGLGWFESGARSFYNSRKVVREPADLQGLKIRAQENELMIALVNAFGAIATPMPYGEVYAALQSGGIDGAENNWPSYFSTSHYEVAKYLVLDEHTRVPEIIIGSKLSLDRLAAADRVLIMKAAADAVDFQRKEWAAYEKLSIDKIRAAGNQVVEVGDKAAWQRLMEPLYARQSPEVRELIARIRALE